MNQSSAELKRKARGDLQGHYGLPMGAMVIMGLITSVIIMPFSIILNLSYSTHMLVIYEIAGIMISLLATVLSAGLLRIHMGLARKETVVFSDLFYGFRNHPDRFLLCALILAAISFGCVTPGTVCLFLAPQELVPLFLCSICLILGGTLLAVLLSLQFALALPLLVDHPSMGTLEAFRTSARLMQGQKGRLFYIQLSFLGWMILCMLSCYIGYLWIGPYMSQVTVTFYLDVTGEYKKQNDGGFSRHIGDTGMA